MVRFLVRVKQGLFNRSKRTEDVSSGEESGAAASSASSPTPAPSPSPGRPCGSGCRFYKLAKHSSRLRKKAGKARYDMVYDEEDKDEALLTKGDDRRLLKDAIFMGLVGHTMGVFCLTYSVAIRVLSGSALLVILSDPLLLLLVGLVALIDFLIFQALFLL